MRKYYVKMFNRVGCNIGEFEVLAKNEIEALNKTIKEENILIEKGDTFEIDDFVFNY